jgi:hypothetical protein
LQPRQSAAALLKFGIVRLAGKKGAAVGNFSLGMAFFEMKANKPSLLDDGAKRLVLYRTVNTILSSKEHQSRIGNKNSGNTVRTVLAS